MAKHVMIFGAGASACTGTPLLGNFIDVAEDLHEERQGHGDHPSADFDLVFDLLRGRLRMLYAKSSVSLLNFEQVFGLIEMARMLGTLPGTTPEEIEPVSRAIRTVLATTIERRCHFRHDSENGINAPEPYRAAVRLAIDPANSQPVPITGKLAFLTFNYDLALDVAVVKAGLPIDYGFGRPSGVPVLKLHGSLNWGVCPSCETIVPVEVQHLITQAQKRLARMRDRASSKALILASESIAKQRPHCGDLPPDPEPALVPPSWNKTEYQERFGSIWKRAAKELSEASEITVVGYSLPTTDAFFHDLMALGLSGPTRIRRFTVVDPTEEVAARFRKLLGRETEARFEHKAMTFENFAKAHLGDGGPRFRALYTGGDGR